MLRGNIVNSPVQQCSIRSDMNNLLVGGGEREKEVTGGMDCYRSRGKAEQWKRYVARHLHGNSVRIWRNVLFAPSRSRFERRGFTAAYIKGRPFEPITQDLVGFASREITPSYLTRRSSSFRLCTLLLSPPPPAALFALNICSVSIDQAWYLIPTRVTPLREIILTPRGVGHGRAVRWI